MTDEDAKKIHNLTGNLKSKQADLEYYSMVCRRLTRDIELITNRLKELGGVVADG